MARSLPSAYTDTLAVTSLERSPSCKVEVYYNAAWQDISANVVSASVTMTMEQRAGEASVRVADPDLDYQRYLGDVDFWSAGSADSPLREGHKIRIYMTNLPAAQIQVFQGYIRETTERIQRGSPRIIELNCIDAGWPAWEREVTIGARVFYDPTYYDDATRRINTIVTAILTDAQVGFAEGDLSLASDGDQALLEWKPSTFRPMQAIDDLMQCLGYRLRFNHEGKAVSFDWNPTGDPAWTYGAVGQHDLIVSFDMKSRPPRGMANKVTVIGRKWGTPGDPDEEEYIWDWNLYYNDWDLWDRPRNGYLVGEGSDRGGPWLGAYTNIRAEVTGGHTEDAWGAAYWGPAAWLPEPRPGIIHVGWQGSVYGDDWVEVTLFGQLIVPPTEEFSATKTVTQLTNHDYTGEVVVENDLLWSNAKCAEVATDAATWLINEMFPATLVVPANLCHEPGDKIRVYLPKGATANDYVDFLLVTHRIEYERGKANLSMLEMVPDFFPTIE